MKCLKLLCPIGLLFAIVGVAIFIYTGRMYPTCFPFFLGLMFLIVYIDLYQVENIANWIMGLREKYL